MVGIRLGMLLSTHRLFTPLSLALPHLLLLHLQQEVVNSLDFYLGEL